MNYPATWSQLHQALETLQEEIICLIGKINEFESRLADLEQESGRET